MTVDEQLREIARRVDEEQRPITIEEIVERAAAQGATQFLEPSEPLAVRNHRPRWFLAAAAVVVAVVAVGLSTIDDEEPDSNTVRVVNEPPPTDSTSAAAEAFKGAVAFAADAGAGESLADPITYRRVETVPEPMDIYVTRAGEPARRLVSSGAHERCAAFSPDGKWFAYLSAPSDSPGGSYPDPGPPVDATLVVLRLDDTIDPSDPELRVPFRAPSGYGVRRRIGFPCPRWSPDGSRLAYVAHSVVPGDAQPGPTELRVVTLDGQEQVVTDMAVGDDNTSFDWSPSGEAIAFLRESAVWAATLDGQAPKPLWQPAGFPGGLSWSSRGELAVTVRTDIAVPGGYREESTVHIVDADGGSEPVGTTNFGWDRAPSWSPDGSRLAFVTTDSEIVLHDRDDGSTVRLPPPVIDGRAVNFCDVAWSASGQQLVVLAHAVQVRFWDVDRDFMESRGMALLSLSTEGALIEVLTPWSWAFDWTNLDDASTYPNE